MSGLYGERHVESFEGPNAMGDTRIVELRVNDYGRWTWWIVYPHMLNAYPTQSENYYDSKAAAKRAARRCLRKLGQ
jgi:hypothetical protein